MADIDDHLAEWLASERDPTPFLNGIGGLGAPFWAADFTSRFIGPGSARQKAVGIAESIVFLIHENIQEMGGAAPRLERVVASGGLARFDGLCQRLADICRLPLYRPAEQEATARGIAYLLGDPYREWPEPVPGASFQPTANAPLDERHRLWRAAMDQALEPRQSSA